MPHRSLLLLWAAALLLTACRAPDPAPTELSELLLFTFTHFSPDDPLNDPSLADAATNLESWFDEEVRSAEDFDPSLGYGGSLVEESDRITDEAIAQLDPQPEAADGAATVGVVVAMETSCTLEQLDGFYLRDDQLELFPENFLTYSRSEQDYDCFLQGECLDATWLSSATQDLVLGVVADYSLRNHYRKIEADSPDGRTVRGRITRAWMPEEATLTPDDLGRWLQNYQLEYAFETEAGLLHVYPQWVQAEFGAINTEASVFLNSYISGLQDYLAILDGHCRAD